MLCLSGIARAQQDEAAWVDSDYARKHRIKAVRVLQGSEEQPAELRVAETYRFSPSGRLLEHRNPGLEEARANTRSGPDYHTDEVTDALGRVLVSRYYGNDQLLSTTYSEYDERGREVRAVSFGETFAEGMPMGLNIVLYGYDEQDNQVEVLPWPAAAPDRLYFGERHRYAFDSQRRPVAHSVFQGPLVPTTSDSTYYDAAGKITRQVTYYHEGLDSPVLGQLRWFRYDAQGRFVEGIDASNSLSEYQGLTWQQNTAHRYRPDGQLAEAVEATARFRRPAPAAQVLRRTLDSLRRAPDFKLQRTTYHYTPAGLLRERRVTSSDLSAFTGEESVLFLTRWEYEYYPRRPARRK